MKIFHGVVVEKSLKEGIICEDLFTVIKIDKNSDWGIKVVEVSEDIFDVSLAKLQESMANGTWYEHFYDDSDTLVIVFKDKIFKVSKAKETWCDMLEYGKALNISEEQLNIYPLEFEQEDDYLNMN